MIDAHRGAFEYDWRTRFHLPLTVVGRRMTYGEALRLTQQLMADPSSHVGASVAGWEHPMSRTGLVLMDLFDLQHITKVKKKPKPYPRPFPDPSKQRTRFGNASLPVSELRSVLDAHRAAIDQEREVARG